jgi:hypothetical protein
VERKETTPLAGRATRWWSAPSRFQAATLALLRKAAAHRELAHGDPWLRQTPNGIRA